MRESQFRGDEDMVDRRKRDATGKFRDTRGRVLKAGESQQKDGRYRFTYVGGDGKPHCLYSWKLEETDKLPAGKRPDIALRTKEKELKEHLEKGVEKLGGNMKVIDLVRYQRLHQVELGESTKKGEQTVENFLLNNELGNKKIEKVTKEYLQSWLKSMKSNGDGYSTIGHRWRLLCKSFDTAVKQKWLIEVPTDFDFNEYVINDSEDCEPLTPEERDSFLDFVKNHKMYSKNYDEIYVLFFTGLRMSEFCGLTLEDLDFEKGIIHIDHQVRFDNGCYVKPVKGQSRKESKLKHRDVPMMKDVKSCLERIVNNRKQNNQTVYSIDKRITAKSDFININNRGNIKSPKNYEDLFVRILTLYNKEHNEHPIKLTPHICRHTFCSALASADMPDKKLMKLMGHTDIKTTLKYYTKINEDELIKTCNRYNDIDW